MATVHTLMTTGKEGFSEEYFWRCIDAAATQELKIWEQEAQAALDRMIGRAGQQ
jgi:hypothetical protein